MSVRLAQAAGIAVLSSLPAAAGGPFDGLWRSSPTAECATASDDGATLKIENDVLLGVDSRCRMTQPVDVRDMDATLYDMVCEDEGEGTDFTERALFLRAADGGLVLLWNGYAFKYEACTPDTALGTVTTSDDIGIGPELSGP